MVDPVPLRPLNTRLTGGENPPTGGGMDERLTKLEQSFARVEATMPMLATKADIESVKAEIQRTDASIVRWMLGTVIALFLGFAGLFLAMSRAQPQGAAPVVISVPSSPAPPAAK